MEITYASVTDRGLNPKRPHNEDALLALPGRGLFLVADGVGGRRGGEVASQTVVDIFTENFRGTPKGDLQIVIAATIKAANSAIFHKANDEEELEGMATTIALVLLDEARTRAVVAHVGDSRVYLHDGRRLEQLTDDHSEVNEAVRAGLIDAAQAASYARRNVINRALGAEAEVEADFRELSLRAGLRFLLCSDGITRHIEDAELEDLLAGRRPPQQICELLKQICYDRGAEDNLTAVIVDCGQRDYAPATTDQPTIQTRRPAPEDTTRPMRRAQEPPSRVFIDLQGQPAPPTQTPSPPPPLPPPPREQWPEDDEEQLAAPPDEAPTRQTARRRPPPPRQSDLARSQVVVDLDQAAPKGRAKAGTMRSLVANLILLVMIALIALLADVMMGDPISGRLRRSLRGAPPPPATLYERHPEDTRIADLYEPFFIGQAKAEATRQDLQRLISQEEEALKAAPDDATRKAWLAEAHFWLGRVIYAEALRDAQDKVPEERLNEKFAEAARTFEKAKRYGLQSLDLRVFLAAAYLKNLRGSSAGENLWPLAEAPVVPGAATSPTATPTPAPTRSPAVTPTPTPSPIASPSPSPLPLQARPEPTPVPTRRARQRRSGQ